MKYEDLSKEQKLNILNNFEHIYKFKNEIGVCPPYNFRDESNCFYCDNCWINVLKKDLNMN